MFLHNYVCNINTIMIASVKDNNFVYSIMGLYLTISLYWIIGALNENVKLSALWSMFIFMTGIGSGTVLGYDMKAAAKIVKEENIRTAKLIGINKAARCTTVKPAGTTSLTLGTSSGIHAWHNDYYIRRIRVGKNEAIYGYLAKNHPDLVEDCVFRGHDTAVISIPQKAPEGSILRTESAFQLLERVKKVADEWVKSGHRAGSNSHNVSATVSLKENEWEAAGEWMWTNRNYYNGLSVLPHTTSTVIFSFLLIKSGFAV